MGRITGTALAASLISWAGLAAGAGNVGLQRSVSIGAWTLFTEQPIAALLAAGGAFLAAFASGRALRLARSSAVGVAGAVLLVDLLGALVLAPLLVGELAPIDAPIVLAAISLYGLQVLAAALGALAASGSRRSAAGTTS